MKTTQNNEIIDIQNSSEFGLTLKGAKTYLSTSHALLDAFAMIGSARDHIYDAFELYLKASQEDRLNTFKLLFWLRDCRGGASEKMTFQVLLSKELYSLYLDGNRNMFHALLSLVPIYGYWKDILIAAKMVSEYDEWIFDFLAEQLNQFNGKSSLLAKYMPRPYGGQKYSKTELKLGYKDELPYTDDYFVMKAIKGFAKNKKNTYVFDQKLITAICQRLHITKAQYKQLLVSHSNTVEQMMSQKKWNHIQYDKLPSAALMLYKSAFYRKDKDRYLKFIKSLKDQSSSKQMNNTHLLPHELVYSYKNQKISDQEFNAYWGQLDQCEGLDGIITMVDTSGSMTEYVQGSRYRYIDVSIGLGLYIANAQSGAFKNQMIIFSEEAIWLNVNDQQSPVDQLNAIPEIAQNTNFHLAYQKLLTQAQERNLSPLEMPKAMVVLSDMEFDIAASHHEVAFEEMKKLFNDAGYELPKIVFWNLHGRKHNLQVKAPTPYTFLFSGFSLSILKSFMTFGIDGLENNALDLMNTVLSSKRYQAVEESLSQFLTIAQSPEHT